jgi:hypothetical protein
MGTGAGNAAASEIGEEDEKAPRVSENREGRRWARARYRDSELLVGPFAVGLFLENLGHD